MSKCWLETAWAGACVGLAVSVLCVGFVAAGTGSAAIAVGFVVGLMSVSTGGCPGDVPCVGWSICGWVMGDAADVRLWVVTM